MPDSIRIEARDLAMLRQFASGRTQVDIAKLHKVSRPVVIESLQRSYKQYPGLQFAVGTLWNVYRQRSLYAPDVPSAEQE